MKIKYYFVWIMLFTLTHEKNLIAQSNDCDGKYNCWVEKAHDALKKERFIDAAYRFAAAQACDDAPVPDTLDSWIQKSYQDNITYIEGQKKETALRIKDAENQEVASNITEDFARIMQQEDVTLQALLLQYACQKTQNMNKLAMRARREILSNPENLFYKRLEQVNIQYLAGTSNFSVDLKELKFNTLLSKDGSVVVEVNESGVIINHQYQSLGRKLPPIAQAKLSPDGKYLYLETLDKGNMKNEVYIASKSTTIKHSYGILRLDNFKWIQDLTTVNHIATVAFSQSSDSLIMIQNEGQIVINDLKRNIITQNGIIKSSLNAKVSNLLMTHLNQNMLVSFNDGSVVLCDNKGKILQRLPLFHNAQITDWDITKNDKYVISGSKDSSVLLWNLSQKFNGFGYHKFDGIVSAVSFSPNDSFSIASSLDNSVILMDKKGDDISHVRGSVSNVIKCGFSANGKTIFTMDMFDLKTYDFKTTNSEESTMDVWQKIMPEILKGDMIFSKNGKYKIFRNTEGVSKVVENGKGEIFTFDSLTTYLFSPNDKYFLTIKKDSVFAWDLEKKELLWTLKSKMMISDAFFSEDSFQNYFILEDFDNQKAELWDFNKSTYAPITTFKEKFYLSQFIANGSLLVNVNGDKTEIRKTTEPRAPIAILNYSDVAFHFNEKDSRLYALFPCEIEIENKGTDIRYSLFEVNVKDKDKNVKLQPSLEFDVPIDPDLNYNFSSSGDSILFKIKNKVLVFQNTIKLMNENRYIPEEVTKVVLDIATKRDNGILSIDDCTEQKDLKNMTECALFFADAVIDDPAYLKQFEEVMTAMNIPTINKANLSENDKLIWNSFDSTLTQIITSYPLDGLYKEKIKVTKQIIEIKEKVLGDKNSKELGTQYGNLSWFILFEDSLNKFQKAMIYGKKAVELTPEDWTNANLGHAYLFNNDFEQAKIHYTFMLENLDTLKLDFDILEKADITHPRMTEMRKYLSDLANKPRKY
jgi:WD40 repeat protein